MTSEHEERAEPPQLAAAMLERGALMGLCYRLLGTVADAEDAVQETYVRWYRLSDAERGAIVVRRAWLITTATRIALDAMQTARARREQYVGEWLPEPVPDPGLWNSSILVAGGGDPADRVSLDESVSMALMVMLESMTPAERVAFVLHDVFRYTFAEVGEIVGRSEEATRRLASVARRRVRGARRAPVALAEHAAVVRSFKRAWETGDLDALVRLLDPDAIAVGDGGGKASALPKPIHGADRIIRVFATFFERAEVDLELVESRVNHEPGLLVRLNGELAAVLSVSVSNGRIDGLWGMRNPEKLASWS